MRVAHLDSSVTLRGGQHQLLHLIDYLSHQGVDQVLLAPSDSALLPHVNISVLPLTWFTLRNVQADIFHAHDARTHTLAALTGVRPLVVSRRVAFPVKQGWLSRWKYRRPDLFLAVSAFVAEQVTAAGVPPEKVRLVYDGIDALPPSSRTGPLIALASTDPMKGNDLVRAAQVPVTFVDDLPLALRTARAMLYITRSEGLGSGALLALSAGVPVIASRVGGLPEIVHDGENGFLVDNTPEAIRAAVARLPELGTNQAASDRIRHLVLRRFLADHMGSSTMAAYAEVMPPSRLPAGFRPTATPSPAVPPTVAPGQGASPRSPKEVE